MDVVTRRFNTRLFATKQKEAFTSRREINHASMSRRH